ncbi:GntR family transcriptional regulator [Brevundimonas vesicularis]|uniref:GntR family transcriptional regulator n=1 Tax=Brevundimonas vesicularis TaxID=41276 RepID=UPI0030BA8371
MQLSEPRDPYGAALGAVRRFADAGRFNPGEPIVVTELAAEVGFSPTPVREALACLAGQGLIERRRGRGYFYPALTAAEIIDLFELEHAYLHAALTLHPRGLALLRKAVVAVDPREGPQALFAAIIAQSSNAALGAAHQRLLNRLRPVIAAERTFADDEAMVVKTMVDTVVAGRIDDLLAQLDAFHERRCARSLGLVARPD